MVQQVARSLARRNSVDMLFGSWSSDHAVSEANQKLMPVPLLHFCRAPTSLTTSMPPTPRGFTIILNELMLRRPNVVHLHGVGHPIVDIAAIFCQRLGISYIIICHGLPLASNPHGLFLRLFYRAYEQLVGSRTLKGATFVIAVSNRVAKSLELKGIPREKIRVSYHIPSFESSPTTGMRFREVAQIPQDRKIILFLGSISYRKGADLALETARKLLGLRRDFVLCLVGSDGGMVQHLKRKIHELRLDEHVIILGHVDSSVRDSALEACDLVLFPSRDEPYGIVPLEAIAHEKPVLVSRCSGVAELLKDSGLLFDADKTELAAERINDILETPELARRLVKQASTFIGSVPVANAEELYEELSTRSSVRPP